MPRSSPVQLDAAVLGGIALVVRLACVRAPMPLMSDSEEYLGLARNLAAARGFTADGITPTSYRPPLYPALIVAAGQSLTAVVLIQCALGAATALLTYLIARRYFDRPTALV